MLYENYQKRILKVADYLAKVVRWLPLIIAALVLIMGSIITLMVVKGNVGDLTCPTDVTYGEQVRCDAKAFWSDVSYEYSSDGSAWSEDMPKLPGKYYVRAVGKGSFGSKKYSKAASFTIAPRKLTVSVADESIVYGDELQLNYNTVYKDTVVCDGFVTEDKWLATGEAEPYPGLTDQYVRLNCKKLKIAPDTKKITVLDKDGNDVTSGYVIEAVTTDITLKYREITIVVEDSTHIYDETPFTFDQYELREGTLKDGDRIIATFDESLTVPGSLKNDPKIKIVNEKGIDVTGYYVIDKEIGQIIVERRPIIIETGSVEIEYNDTSVYCYDYKIDPSTPLIEGHKLKLLSGTTVKDCGEYDNNLNFQIVDKNGVDKTLSYSFFFNEGTIKITPKRLEVFTGDGEWVYDGFVHNEAGLGINYKVEGLLKYHDIMPAEINENCTICDVGVKENKCHVIVLNGKMDDVTKNYEIVYTYGKLEVTPRPFTFATADGYWIYDGEFHSQPEYSFKGKLSFHNLEPVGEIPEIRDSGTLENKWEIKIVDEEGIDKTHNYSITYVYGTIEVGKRKISLVTDSYDWIYDGEEHYWHEYYAESELGVVEGETLVMTGLASIIDVGTVKNSFEEFNICRYGDIYEDSDCVVMEAEDVTFNYEVTWSYGILEILPRPIVCKPVDEEKVYDDTPLTPTAVEISPNSPYDLVSGHTLVASMSGSITDVGMAPSYITSAKVMNGDADISYNYEIIRIEGTLTVTPRQITVFTGSAEKDEYDGKPLTCKEYGVYPDKLYDLVDGHKIRVKTIGSQTEVGESPNICDESYTRITSGTRNVTHNYEIQYDCGTLTVKPIATIVVISGSDWKYYDGTPLVCKEYDYTVKEGAIAEELGHRLVVEVTGSITQIGGVSNTTKAKVVDRNGKDVSKYYKIIVSEGMLEIREKKQEEPIEITIGQIMTQNGGYVYLKEQSYGDYNGRGWNSATPYWKLLPEGVNYSYLSGIALKNSGCAWDEAVIKDILWYMLPYYMAVGDGYDMPQSDTVFESTLSNYYVPFYSVEIGKDGYAPYQNNLGIYSKYEEEYRDFVYQTYLNIDVDSRKYMDGIIAEQHFDILDPEVVQKIATYIQNAAKYDLGYDIAMDSEKNVAIAFLDKYKTGICVHYASAATLLYRALGIPARYVEGFALQTKAGEFVDIKTPGHAWVEVYIDGLGWMQVEVTGAMEGGSGPGPGPGPGPGGEGGEGGIGVSPGGAPEMDKDKIEITPRYQWKHYDGKPLYAVPELEVNGTLADLISKGYSYYVEIQGSQTEIGIGSSEILNFILYDADDKDVTDNFEVVYHEGVLEVLPPDKQVIRVYLYQLQKYYDGTELRFGNDDFEIIEAPDGVYVDLDLNIAITNVGSLTLTKINSNQEEYVSYRVYKDGRDVTENFVLIFDTFEATEKTYIPLRVDARPITITSASEAKLEDGYPLENHSFVISQGTLANGHQIDVTIIGYIDFVGEATNEIEWIIVVDENGNDVTENYKFKCVLGKLTIVPSDE